MEMTARGPAQRGLTVAALPAVDSSRLPGVNLRAASGKGPDASMLSTVPLETSEKPLPPGFLEAESLVSQDTAGEHPSE